MGPVLRTRPVPALAAPGDPALELDVDDVRPPRGTRERSRLGARRRHGPVGRIRKGAAWTLGVGDPGLLLRRPAPRTLPGARTHPRPGRERSDLDPRRALRDRRHGRRAGRDGARDDRRWGRARGVHRNVTSRSVFLAGVAAAVAIAFADSSIVVLALPELYGRFDTTIEGVAWVLASCGLALAVAAVALVLVVHRVRAGVLLAIGSVVFLAASIACAVSNSIAFLIAARSVQGLGGALLLAGSLPVLAPLAGSTARGVAVWTTAGTPGAALGPALGGVLTQAFDWRAIFVFQAPLAGLAPLGAVGSHVPAMLEEGWTSRLGHAIPANLGLAMLSGALVGALFLGVVLVIDVFGLTPIQGAAVVSAIPVATVLARPIAASLPVALAVGSGAVLLAGGLIGLAFLPSSALGYTVASFALCGFGLGLSVPGLTHSVLGRGGGIGREGTLTVGVRHLGLVLALAIVAPLLSSELLRAEDVAQLNGTAVVIDGLIPATTKVPLALDIRDAIDRARKGEIPDLGAVFEEHGAGTDPAVRAVQDDLMAVVEAAVTRSFRSSFLVCALLALLALVPMLAFRRRLVS